MSLFDVLYTAVKTTAKTEERRQHSPAVLAFMTIVLVLAAATSGCTTIAKETQLVTQKEYVTVQIPKDHTDLVPVPPPPPKAAFTKPTALSAEERETLLAKYTAQLLGVIMKYETKMGKIVSLQAENNATVQKANEDAKRK